MAKTVGSEFGQGRVRRGLGDSEADFGKAIMRNAKRGCGAASERVFIHVIWFQPPNQQPRKASYLRLGKLDVGAYNAAFEAWQ